MRGAKSARDAPGDTAATGLRIRGVKLEDAARLAELSSQLSYPNSPEQVGARLPALLQFRDQAIFVAEANGAEGRIVGFVHVQVRHAVEHDARAEVISLVVDEAVRSQGVGARLMGAAEDWARGQGMKLVVLRSNVVRERAHKFYERLGYRNTKSQKFFAKDL